MPGALLNDNHGSEPLAPWTHAQPTPEIFGDARCLRFEFASRGDRVPGRLLLPASEGPHPLILLQHGAGGSKEAPYLDVAAPWVRGGAAVAGIDFPLHGERADAKLSVELARARNPEAVDKGESAGLWSEFARQSVTDLGRAVDALGELPELDSERLAYGGFSLGGMLGTLFCAADPRPRAAALALAGGGFGPSELDPCRHVGALAPRPLLLLNARNDQTVPPAAAEALFAAARDPKRIEWFDTDHSTLPGVALKTMWHFLRDAVGLGEGPR